MIVDVLFTDDTSIPAGAQIQALKFLLFALESNLRNVSPDYLIVMGGTDRPGLSQRSLHFHTEAPHGPDADGLTCAGIKQ